jgi:type III pantothenate kinase
MYLAIDIGNTALKFALFDAEALIEKGIGIDSLASVLHHHTGQISRAIMASVADSVAAIAMIRKFNIPLTILTHQTPLPIRNLYQTPETLGTDRLTLAVAADRIFGGAPALVIGAGTCITYNFIHEGAYIGGAISPGITMRFQSLHHYTARLPLIDWTAYQDRTYDTLVGLDSAQSIVSGVLNGVLREIDGTIDQYRLRYSGLRVAVTGGDMPFLVKNLKNDIFARPDMVLEGLNYILLHHA